MKFFCTIVFFCTFILHSTAGCTPESLPSTREGSRGTATPLTTHEGSHQTATPLVIVPVESDPDPLSGTRWELVAFENEEKAPRIPQDLRLHVEFNKGSLSLQGGCNAVGGYYLIENDRITITFAERTEIDCSDSMPGINEVEIAFSLAMPTFDSYTIEGDQLRVRYVHGELLFHHVGN